MIECRSGLGAGDDHDEGYWGGNRSGLVVDSEVGPGEVKSALVPP